MARALTFFAIAFLGCQTPYLIGRGDQALERGEPDRALADYLAALERRTSKGNKGAIKEKIERAALVVVKKEIEEAKALAAKGALDEARDRLWGIVVADAWGATAAKEAVLDALAELDRPRWEEIEALAKEERFVPALKAAHELVAPYPEGHPMRARFADLSQRAQQHHLTRASASAEKPVAWFHHRLAINFGAPAGQPVADLEREIAASAAYAWRVDIDAEKCPMLARVITERLAKSDQRGPVAEVRFDECRELDQSWSEREKRTYPDRVPKVRFTEEQYWVEERDPACDPEACLRYDELGVCVERPPVPPGCDRVERKLAVRRVPVIEYESVQRELEVEVLRRKLEIEARGLILFDGEAPVPFETKQTFDDRAFWTPSESRRFAVPDRTQIAERAFAEVKRAMDRRVAEVRVTRAIAASKEASGERAEALHVLAVFSSNTVPEPAAKHFSTSYDLNEADVLAVLGKSGSFFSAGAPPMRRELPAAELDPELDEFEQTAVVREQEVPGLALMAETGVDLAFTGGTTALKTADQIYGLEARVRVLRLLVTGSAQSAGFLGDVGGFGLSLTGLTFDLEKTGLFLEWGLAYAQQETDAGERYRIFTIPIRLHVPIFSWAWFGASFEPNLLYAKTIFDDAEGDPHFWSPVRAWVVLDLFQRVYLQAGIAHHLGAGFDSKPVQAELMLGARL